MEAAFIIGDYGHGDTGNRPFGRIAELEFYASAGQPGDAPVGDEVTGKSATGGNAGGEDRCGTSVAAYLLLSFCAECAG